MTTLGVENCLSARRNQSDNPVWILPLSDDEVRDRSQRSAAGPLAGATFAIKDNIDLAGQPTTAACPEYAYSPEKSATVVDRLMSAGAVPLGKTNLDQFATGLVGVRSPYGVPVNPFGAEWIPGGSSSGSAVAVATGQVDFALGTDTAGSGRVPASFNELVGLKPTCGLLSTTGVVPACRTLDSVSIFTRTIAQAAEVLAVAAEYDPSDAYSRRIECAGIDDPLAPIRVGVPQADQLEFYGDENAAALFTQAVERWRTLGAEIVEIDYGPFVETARLLYEGPWVAERYAAIKSFIESDAAALHPVTNQIIGGAGKLTAVSAFEAQYRLAELRRRASAVWSEIDVMLTPTAPTCYTVAELEADPIQLNSNLGHYTNHMNLLDLCAVAVPVGRLPSGIPWGVTLSAPAFCDDRVLRLGALFMDEAEPQPALADKVARARIAVCGAHLSGLPLNGQLTSLGGRLVTATQTAPDYRLYALPDTTPPKPGLVRVREGGVALEVEIWELPVAGFGRFVTGIPSPLGIGTLALADGSEVQGFICEASAVAEARDVSEFGGWRGYIASLT